MNYFLSIWFFVALAAAARANGLGPLGPLVYAPGHASPDYYAYPKYAFEYAVKDPHTGDNKAQWEKRDGDVVKGAYSLVEPDGSLRIVEYWADDKSGFNAVVKRVGPNLHPTGPAVHAPIYKAPIPTLEHSPILGPVTIGPVAKYGGLAGAPLLTGPVGYGGAVSTASLVKAGPVPYPAPYIPAPIVKPVLPIAAPIYSAPIIKPAPILYPAPIYKGPVLEPIGHGPLIRGPGIPDVALGEGLLRRGHGYGGYGGYDEGYSGAAPWGGPLGWNH